MRRSRWGWLLGPALAGMAAPSGCASDSGSTGPEVPVEVTVSITPESALLDAGESLQFTATITGAVDTGVIWSVDGAAERGTISTDGLYAAPGAIPWPRATVLQAASTEQPVATATAVVEFPEPDFRLEDINENSATHGTQISPRDLRDGISAWYFGSAT